MASAPTSDDAGGAVVVDSQTPPKDTNPGGQMHDERDYLTAQIEELVQSNQIVVEGWRRTYGGLRSAVESAITELRTGTAPRGVIADDLSRALNPHPFPVPVTKLRRPIQDVVPQWEEHPNQTPPEE